MSDYQEAIQNPGTCLGDPELKRGRPALNRLGLPNPVTGAFASVYQINCGRHKWAVRCFVRRVTDQQARYAAIGRHLRAVSLPYKVGFEYQEQGILVRGQWFPIVKMEWVDGLPLNSYISSQLGNRAALEKLARDWLAMVKRLKAAKVAHGDLQHGNVLVCNGALRLIDYDGMCVPALAEVNSHETGHPSYQHPARAEPDYGPDMDHFPSMVIYLAILTLSRDPDLWWLFNDDDNLLFRRADFLDPYSSRLFDLLVQMPEKEVAERAAALQLACLTPLAKIAEVPATVPAAAAAAAKPARPPVADLPAWVADQLGLPAPRRRGARSTSSEPAPITRPGGPSTAGPAHQPASPVARPAMAPLSRVPRFSFDLAMAWCRPGSVQEKALRTEPVYTTRTRRVRRQVAVPMPVLAWFAYVAMQLVTALVSPPLLPATSLTGPAMRNLLRFKRWAEVEEQYRVQVGTRQVEETITKTIPGHVGPVLAVGFSHDGKTLASAGDDRNILLWDAGPGKQLAILGRHDAKVTGIAPVPVGTGTVGLGAVGAGGFVTSSWDHTLRVWPEQGKPARVLRSGIATRVYAVATTTDGSRLAGASGQKEIQVWDTHTSKQVARLRGHTRKVSSVAFMPAGGRQPGGGRQLLISGSSDSTVRIWDIHSRTCLAVLHGHVGEINTVAVSPDGKLIASGGDDGLVIIRDSQSYRITRAVQAGAPVHTLAFPPDSSCLLAGASDGRINCWAVPSGRFIGSIAAHTGAVRSVAVSPDGSSIASCGDDGRVTLWRKQVTPKP
jgi:hypothetical protein